MKSNSININNPMFKGEVKYNELAEKLLKSDTNYFLDLDEGEYIVIKNLMTDLNKELKNIAKTAPNKDTIDFSISYKSKCFKNKNGLNKHFASNDA